MEMKLSWSNLQTSKTYVKRNYRILIVEDHPELGAIIKNILEDHGYECAVYLDALAIGEALQTFIPDLILCDYLLPLKNGGDLCQEVKNSPSGRNIPVIMISSLPAFMLPLGQCGCNAFLQKPFSIYALLKQVKILCINQPV